MAPDDGRVRRGIQGRIGAPIFVLPTHDVMGLNSPTALHHSVMFARQNAGLSGVRGSHSCIEFTHKTGVDAVERIPIIARLTAVPFQIGDAVSPTSDASVLISPFRGNIIFGNVMGNPIIVGTEAGSIAFGCGCSRHDVVLIARMVSSLSSSSKRCWKEL